METNESSIDDRLWNFFVTLITFDMGVINTRSGGDGSLSTKKCREGLSRKSLDYDQSTLTNTTLINMMSFTVCDV